MRGRPKYVSIMANPLTCVAASFSVAGFCEICAFHIWSETGASDPHFLQIRRRVRLFEKLFTCKDDVLVFNLYLERK